MIEDERKREGILVFFQNDKKLSENFNDLRKGSNCKKLQNRCSHLGKKKKMLPGTDYLGKKKKNPRTPSCVRPSFYVAQGKTLTTPALSHLQNPTVYSSDGHLSGKRRPCIRLLIYVFSFSSNVLSLSYSVR